MRGKGFGASVAPPHLWGRYVCTDPRHGWRRLKRKFIFVMSSTRVAQKPKYSNLPHNTPQLLSSIRILHPIPTIHRISPNFTESRTSFTVSVADLPRGPVFAHQLTHFTPFSNFLKKKVNFFQKRVDMGLPLCYTLDD